MRAALLRYVRATPRADDREGADKRVFILLWTAWGMGGTIRAAFNLAEYLIEHGYEVEVISRHARSRRPVLRQLPRRRGGDLARRPAQRRRAGRPAQLGCGACCARSRACSCRPPTAPSRASTCGPTSSSRGRLRGRSGFLLGTRPGVNLMVARLNVAGDERDRARADEPEQAQPPSARGDAARSTRSSTRSWCSPTRTGEAYERLLDDSGPAPPHPQHRAAAARGQGRPHRQDRLRGGALPLSEGLRPADPRVGRDRARPPRLAAAAPRQRPPRAPPRGPDRRARARGLRHARRAGRGHRRGHGRRPRCSCSPRASRASR